MNLAKLFAENKSKVLQGDKRVEKTKIKSKIDKLESTDLGTIKGVGDSTVKTLLENGISSLDELRGAGVLKVRKLNLNPLSYKEIKKFLQSK